MLHDYLCPNNYQTPGNLATTNVSGPAPGLGTGPLSTLVTMSVVSVITMIHMFIMCSFSISTGVTMA